MSELYERARCPAEPPHGWSSFGVPAPDCICRTGADVYGWVYRLLTPEGCEHRWVIPVDRGGRGNIAAPVHCERCGAKPEGEEA